MKNLRNRIGLMLMLLLGLTSCQKEEITPEETTNQETGTEEPTKTELIAGSYTITLGVVNNDTIDSNSTYMDQTFVIQENKGDTPI